MNVQMNPNVNFLFMDNLSGFFFNPHKREGLTFTAPVPNQINLSLVPSDPEKDDSGIMRGLTCKVYSTVNVPQSMQKFVASLLAGRFEGASTLKLPHVLNGEEKIDAAGNIKEGYRVSFGFYPAEVQEICNSVGNHLKRHAERFIKLLRWQQEIDAPHVIFDGLPPLYWNVGGTYYHAVGFPRQSSGGRSPLGITWDVEDQREMLGIWSRTDLVEPLAHEMLREAKAAIGSSPRSALLIAASAIEVGVKMHVSRIAPDTSWLVREMPSPPIFKMLRDYLPELHLSKGKQLSDWNKLKPLFNTVQYLAEDRNSLTHKGEMPERATTNLQETLMTVSDLLYILDVIEGHEWARGNVQGRTLKLLGWPKPRRQRFFVKMEIGAG